MNFEPFGDRVLVERIEESQTTISGIIIPDSAKEKPLQAKIVAISKEVEDEGLMAVNDTVLFAKYSGTELSLNGIEYLVLETNDILGKMKK